MTDLITYVEGDGYCKGVELYPDESTKPAEGTELNKPCVITVYFKKGRKVEKMKAQTEKMPNQPEFLDYQPKSGVLKFKVKHFTKYVLDSDSDEEDAAPTNTAADEDSKAEQSR